MVVDGAFADHVPALHLSHWPGNHTPEALKHELSTGIALNFNELPDHEQTQLIGHAEAWVNSHYDTDGCMALFALKAPAQARAHRQLLLQAAGAGDFFRWPNDHALALDAIVTGLAESEHAPPSAYGQGTSAEGRWQACTEHLLAELPKLLRGELTGYRDLWQPALERGQRDLEQLRNSKHRSLPELGLAIWRMAPGAPGPGRHALFGSTLLTRALVFQGSGHGLGVRLIESTQSWFEVPGQPAGTRPNLVALAEELQSMEPASSEGCWHAQEQQNPSPELWFGEAELGSFAEHNAAQGWSGLSIQAVESCVEANLRRAIQG